MKGAEEIEKDNRNLQEIRYRSNRICISERCREIEKIIEVCKKYNIEITGSVFMKGAEEIEKIIEVCKKYNIGITV